MYFRGITSNLIKSYEEFGEKFKIFTNFRKITPWNQKLLDLDQDSQKIKELILDRKTIARREKTKKFI